MLEGARHIGPKPISSTRGEPPGAEAYMEVKTMELIETQGHIRGTLIV